jgi:hypothetical protein
MDEQVLDFFKTFSDINRIKIAALLAEQPAGADEIATRLGLRPVDVTRHVTMIERLGLLRSEGDRFCLDIKALERLSREALAGRRPAVEVQSKDPNADAFDHKTVRNYSLPDGRLREIPLTEKKFLAVLRHVAQVFEPGRKYTEKEVNEVLKQFHADFATLRRGLYDAHLIERSPDGAAYWRKEI